MNATIAAVSVAPGTKAVFGAGTGKTGAAADAFGGMLAVATSAASVGSPGGAAGGARMGVAGGGADGATNGVADTDSGPRSTAPTTARRDASSDREHIAAADDAAGTVQQLPLASASIGSANHLPVPLGGTPAPADPVSGTNPVVPEAPAASRPTGFPKNLPENIMSEGKTGGLAVPTMGAGSEQPISAAGTVAGDAGTIPADTPAGSVDAFQVGSRGVTASDKPAALPADPVGVTPVGSPGVTAGDKPAALPADPVGATQVAPSADPAVGQAGPDTEGAATSGAPVFHTAIPNGFPGTQQRAGTVAVGTERAGVADATGTTTTAAGRDSAGQPMVHASGIPLGAVDRSPVAGVPAFTMSTTPEPLNRQLAGPIATLATGPHGDRTLTINVAPDGLGPVSVRAHLGAEGLRVELLAPTDAGREALRQMLPDLKRDLAGLGAGTLSLSTGDKHDGGSAGGRPGDGQQHTGQPGSRHSEAGPFAGRQLGIEPGDRGVATVADTPRAPEAGAGTGQDRGSENDPLPGSLTTTPNPPDPMHRRFQPTVQLDVMA